MPACSTCTVLDNTKHFALKTYVYITQFTMNITVRNHSKEEWLILITVKCLSELMQIFLQQENTHCKPRSVHVDAIDIVLNSLDYVIL